MVRRHAIARGRVQGVGFRYVCQSIASKCNVTGWVKNNFDGTVEMEVQGAEHRVDLFLQQVAMGNRFARVDRLDVIEIPPLNALAEKGFRVKY